MTTHNPFGSEHGRYAAYVGKRLIYPHRPDQPPAVAAFVHDQLRGLIGGSQFPCLGAKAAINQGSYRFGFYPEMGSDEATEGLCHDLFQFASDEWVQETSFATFMASFAGPYPGDERELERLLWQQLQRLHDADSAHHRWDPTVSPDPEHADFSFSFAEKAFFVVGLCAGSSRWSRRFAWPTLVFNPHSQFERLRADGLFYGLQAEIRNRDIALQGNANPNLTDHGEASEARQYSGRPVEPDWHCLFRPKGSQE